LSSLIGIRIFEITGRTDTNDESSKDTNVKSEINKLTTNKFLENNCANKKTSEENPSGYCNVDFVFTLGSNKCFLYL
jgi:hypothetical protein